MRPSRPVSVAAWVLLSIAASDEARAQISPGPLSQRHATLEGAGSCGRCHAPRRGVDPVLCLDCHVVLSERIEAAAGLHARPELAACERCHVEHQGRQFELVWWGEEGIERFEHAQTGHELDGAHADLPCRDCHRAERIADPSKLRAASIDLDRTYLGLSAECAACHRDPHDGQLAAKTCDACHGQTAFAPAPGFDHDAARFRLTGGHRRVACARCHPSEPAAARDAPLVRYRPLAFAACSDCHRDPHQGSLGERCSSCHSTASWSSGERSSFDHDRTAYPLRGAHIGADCAGCHGERLVVARPESSSCATCHADAHTGQLAHRNDGGACEGCHTIDTFSPSTFTIVEHGSTSYPLEGSHRRVDCRACHAADTAPPVATGPAPASDSPGAGARRHSALVFRFPDVACGTCHRDPHLGDADAVAGDAGCARCHDLSGWASVAFDHTGTSFELERGHWGHECSACHPFESDSGEVRFRLDDPSCAGCHEDVHGGQLAAASGAERGRVDCARCHVDSSWSEVRFDHSGARFPLDGAHVGVACEDCHPTERVDGSELVRYRPLRTDCAACHAARPDQEPGG
jgi:hypothetical protein